MIRNYLTSTTRYVAKNKLFSLSNVLGLAIGMTACLLIAQYVLHEFSYDSFHVKKERIYRLQLDRYDKGQLSTRWAAGAAGIGPSVKDNFPEIESFVRLTKSNALLANGDKFFKEDGVYYSSEDFFKIFSIKLISGTDSSVLREPNKMVVSRSLAKKYFGDENPVGKTLKNNGRTEYEITGVFEDLPANTHMKIDALFSFATYIKLVNDPVTSWNWDGFMTYILLKEGVNAQALETKLASFVDKQNNAEGHSMVFHLQPLTDIHLDSDYYGEFKNNGDRQATSFLAVVAVLILIIAWINYINLSTAKSIERAKEVGVRKVMGGFRKQLVQQFLMESLVINSAAIAIALTISVLVMPWFSEITERELSYALFKQPLFWLVMVGLILMGSLLAGLYPAFVLSAFKPVEVLKGKFRNSSRGVVFRKGMVIAQFIASITLVVGTFTVYTQLTFMRNQELGVDLDQTLVLNAPNITDSTYARKFEAFKNTIVQYPEVKFLSVSSAVPGSQPYWNAGGIRRLSQTEDEAKQYRVISMDADYVQLFGLETLAGRAFSNESQGEEDNIMLNESAFAQMGFSNLQEAIGEQINFWGDTFRIIGVVKNFHQESLKKSFDPLIFRYSANDGDFFSIKFNTSEVKQSIAKFEDHWKAFFGGNPFIYFFLDEHYDKQYKADQRFGQVFGIFSGIAIFIACLGLFALSSLTAIQRTKEIGVRKVLGASVPSILTLIGKDYLLLLIAAILVSTPIAWWLMDNWLNNFAYRTELAWWIFAVPTILVIVIALTTVSIHTWRAANINPGQTLKYE